MSDLIHLMDEPSRAGAVYCDAVTVPLYGRPGDYGCVDYEYSAVTCPKCIEAYETRPQPVTTEDLLVAVRLLRRIVNRHGRVGGGPDPDIVALNALEKRLERPRKITRDRTVADGTCGKCGGFVAAGDDCSTCYPR